MITSNQNGCLSYLLVDMAKEGNINEAKKTKDTLVELFNELNEVTEKMPEPAGCDGNKVCGGARC